MAPENERGPGEGAPNDVPGAGGHADDLDFSSAAGEGNEAGESEPRATAGEFLTALFGDDHDGFIEVRLIEEKRPDLEGRPQVIHREWSESPRQVLAALPRLRSQAEGKLAAVYLGVLPRRAGGVGKAEHTLPGCVVWADLDFKDFSGGEAEARARLEEFPLPPSIVVASGHGLHTYWLLREPDEPDELSRISKRLATSMGGDHVFDAARLLRLPGTRNLKDPEHPILVEIEDLDADRRYNASEVEDALDLLSTERPDPDAVGGDSQQVPPGKLPASVRDLIASKPRIANLFVGKGKPENGPDGRPLDGSSSGYDFSLVFALVKAGVRAPAELAAALANRPDGRAREKGATYIQRTVQRGLAQFEKTSAKALTDLVNFKVECLRVFKSEPATYEFTVEGHQIVLSSAQLRRPSAFATAFLDTLHRIPAHPTGSDWAELVNLWLTEADYVEMPPEASAEQALREDVERLVEELPVGDAVSDVDHGKAFMIEGAQGFKSKALMRALREDYPGLGSHRLCKTLRDLGFDNGTVRLDGTPVRLWRRVTDSTYMRAREKPEVE